MRQLWLGRSAGVVAGVAERKSELGAIDPLRIADLKKVFALLHKPRNFKKFAQNFLVDRGVRDVIIETAAIGPEDQVLEIGPGSGVLTQVLVKQAARVVALDIDPYLLEVTRLVCRNAKNLELRLEDVRQINLPELFCQKKAGVPGKYLVVSNLPYYLTGYVLELLTSSTCPPQKIVLTVQREVAERLVALPGQHTLLSISVALFGQAELVRVITRRAFWPAPNVDSAVIKITRHKTPIVTSDTQRQLFRVIKAGFSARRKKLSNALSGGLRVDVKKAADALAQAGLAANARAQELTLEQWLKLAEHLQQLSTAE